MIKHILFLAVSLMVSIINGTEPRADELTIINKTLNLSLPPTEIGDCTAVNDIVYQATKHIWDGNYDAALAFMINTVERFPYNFYVQARLASILGDYAEMFSGELRERMINHSKSIFSKLLPEVEGQSKADYFFFKNEYCFRFALYKEQYELGFEKLAYYAEINEWDKRAAFGYYSQGVGAANYAKQLLAEGDAQHAHAYAQKALVAWAQHFRFC